MPEALKTPWKYIGYRASFLDSDNDFQVFRKFGTLNSRLLLYPLDKIIVTEKELVEIDLHYSREETGDVNNGSFEEEMLMVREQALERIHHLIIEYSKEALDQTWTCKFPDS